MTAQPRPNANVTSAPASSPSTQNALSQYTHAQGLPTSMSTLFPLAPSNFTPNGFNDVNASIGFERPTVSNPYANYEPHALYDGHNNQLDIPMFGPHTQTGPSPTPISPCQPQATNSASISRGKLAAPRHPQFQTSAYNPGSATPAMPGSWPRLVPTSSSPLGPTTSCRLMSTVAPPQTL